MASAVSSDTALLRRRFDAVRLVAMLPTQVREVWWSRALLRRGGCGTRVAAQGAPADVLIVLLTGGIAAVADSPGGRSIGVARWEGPSLVDKVTTFSGAPRTAGLVARTAVEWCELPLSAIESALAEHPAVRRHVLRALAQEADTTRGQVVAAHTQSVLARLAGWLLAHDDATVALPASQALLAEELGTTRVSLNRALHQLVGSGAIIRGSHRIVRVVDPAALRSTAEQLDRDPGA